MVFLQRIIMTALPERIITDAGIDYISYPIALILFNKDQVDNSWQTYATSKNHRKLKKKKVKTTIKLECTTEELIENHYKDFRGRIAKIPVITARAVLGNHKWVKILSLYSDTSRFSNFHEQEAISLGVLLRAYINRENSIIVNDNQNAVWQMSNTFSSIIWMKRDNVREAHCLKLSDASYVLLPDDYYSHQINRTDKPWTYLKIFYLLTQIYLNIVTLVIMIV